MIVVRGGGDLATGTIHKLFKCGFQILVLETDYPSAIRRTVAFSEAVYQGTQTVEGVTCYLAKDVGEAKQLLSQNQLVMLVDKEARCLDELDCDVFIDATIAKKNLGTYKTMAPLTIALGPGFKAGEDVDIVIETKRGHTLGRIIEKGFAIQNTGIPGMIGGYGKERVIHSSIQGIIHPKRNIGDIVSRDEVIAVIENENQTVEVKASIDGLLRGMIRDCYPVTVGFKIADIDPRIEEKENCYTISDKARCIAGGVLEAILSYRSIKL